MDASWVSVLPPLIVIGAIVATHRLNISLAAGIVSAALLATHGHVGSALTMCASKVVTHFSDIDNILLYVLLVIISSLIMLLTVTGSAAGCAQIIGRKMRTTSSVEMASILLAFLLSIDDYLSILTVGFVMRPIADRLAVARTKLAYIVHALAGPLVIIVPISTWAAAVLAQLDNAGIGTSETSKIIADPFYVYINTIPFIFYSLLAIMSVIFVVAKRVSFGPILRDERDAVPVYDESAELQKTDKHSLYELLVPMGLLVAGVFFGILNNYQTFLVFFLSSLVAFGVSLCIFLYKRMIVISQLPTVVYEGFALIKSSVIMVALASILGSFLRLDLHTGSYVATVLLSSVPLCVIPVMVFIVSLLITLATGSAWGTFSLLIPITIEMIITLLQVPCPVRLEQISLLFPTLGALLSGAACGNHIAPFAETTIMTATSTGIEPLVHARTQLPYAVPIVLGSFVAFIVVGIMNESSLWMSFFVSFSLGTVTCLSLLIAGGIFFHANSKIESS